MIAINCSESLNNGENNDPLAAKLTSFTALLSPGRNCSATTSVLLMRRRLGLVADRTLLGGGFRCCAGPSVNANRNSTLAPLSFAD
jgi:hypothetical protein